MRAARRLVKLINGKTTIAFRGFMYKFVLRRSNIPQLQRECSYSNLAERSDFFAGHVVSAESLSPRVIRYPLVSVGSALSEKVEAMLSFCRQRQAQVQNCARQKASVILENYCLSLGVDRRRFGECNKVDAEKLEFQLPVTFMHGDFGPSNTGLRENSLAIFDWEFASEHGSILYDFWYIDHICRFKQYSNEVTHRTNRFICDVIAEHGLDCDAFRYFCRIMNAVQGCKK